MAEAPESENVDNLYLKEEIGQALVEAVASVCDSRPADPIHYLATKLYDYRREHPFLIDKTDHKVFYVF